MRNLIWRTKMKLTHAMRNKFIDDVMARVPMKSPHTQDSILQTINARLKALWPAGLDEFVCKFPSQVNCTSHYIGWLSFHEKVNGETKCRDAHSRGVNGYNHTSMIDTSDLKALWNERLAELEERAALRSKISQQVFGVTTTQALAALFPDLVGLIPKDPPKGERLMPVAAKGLIDELKASGMKVPV